ncbi:hypothetical protein GCM10020000_86710 [Streptomyces olivoverticillatus]
MEQPAPARDGATPGPDELKARQRMLTAITRYGWEKGHQHMTTDQADAAAKSVTDVLASIDDVLEDVEAQASPAGPAAPTPNVAAEEQSGSGTEEAAEASQAAVTLAKGPLAPATPTAATHGPGAPSRAAQPGNDTAPPAWWDKVYRDQDADLDTHTGNVPGPLSPDEGLDAPPMPDHAPQVPSTEAQKPGDGPGDIPAELPSARRRLRLHKLRRRENADGDQEGELEPPAQPSPCRPRRPRGGRLRPVGAGAVAHRTSHLLERAELVGRADIVAEVRAEECRCCCRRGLDVRGVHRRLGQGPAAAGSRVDGQHGDRIP